MPTLRPALQSPAEPDENQLRLLRPAVCSWLADLPRFDPPEWARSASSSSVYCFRTHRAHGAKVGPLLTSTCAYRTDKKAVGVNLLMNGWQWKYH